MYYNPVPTLMKMFRSKNLNIKVHTVWALSNLAGDCDDFKKMICTKELMERVYELLQEVSTLDFLKVLAWAMTNFTQGCGKFTQEYRELALQVAKFLMKIEDDEIEQSTMWVICSLTSGDDNDNWIFEEMRTEEFGIFDLVRKHSKSDIADILISCVRICINATASNDELAQMFIDEDLLKDLTPLIHHKSPEVRKEILLVISNLSASNAGFQIDYLMSQPIFKQGLMLINDTSDKVRWEASWIYNNLSSSCSEEQLLQTLSLGVLDYIKEALAFKDPEIVIFLLKFIEALLKAGQHESEQAGDTSNQVAVLLDESGCLTALENAQDMQDEIYNKIGEIIETYYGVDDEASEVPIEVPDGGFDFS
jgi:importin subunit alpha-6/7